MSKSVQVCGCYCNMFKKGAGTFYGHNVFSVNKLMRKSVAKAPAVRRMALFFANFKRLQFKKRQPLTTEDQRLVCPMSSRAHILSHTWLCHRKVHICHTKTLFLCRAPFGSYMRQKVFKWETNSIVISDRLTHRCHNLVSWTRCTYSICSLECKHNLYRVQSQQCRIACSFVDAQLTLVVFDIERHLSTLGNKHEVN